MKKTVFLIIAVMVLVAVQTGWAAEEELFDTKAASALFDKGMEQLNRKNLDGAIGAFEESVSIAPEARTYYFLGYAYYLKGKTGDAESRQQSIENFDKAYELDPNFTPNKTAPAAPVTSKEKAEPAGGTQVPDKGSMASGMSQTNSAAANQQ